MRAKDDKSRKVVNRQGLKIIYTFDFITLFGSIRYRKNRSERG
jgi:hypothetical protein